jgi:GNAT superfamily N-acetyltransferase
MPAAPTLPSIQECTTPEAIAATWPVMRQLRPHITSEEAYVAQVCEQQQQGFRLVALLQEGQCVAVAGFRTETRLHTGTMLYVADLVTDAARRSDGAGRHLLDWLKEEAKRHGCTVLKLDSGVQRQRAHAFYFREGLHIDGYTFNVALEGAE